MGSAQTVIDREAVVVLYSCCGSEYECLRLLRGKTFCNCDVFVGNELGRLLMSSRICRLKGLL